MTGFLYYIFCFEFYYFFLYHHKVRLMYLFLSLDKLLASQAIRFIQNKIKLSNRNRLPKGPCDSSIDSITACPIEAREGPDFTEGKCSSVTQITSSVTLDMPP